MEAQWRWNNKGWKKEVTKRKRENKKQTNPIKNLQQLTYYHVNFDCHNLTKEKQNKNQIEDKIKKKIGKKFQRGHLIV